MQTNKQDPKQQLNNYAKYSSMAFQMIAIILIGTYGGVKLDEYLQIESQIFTIVLSLFSTFAAIYLFLKEFISKKQ
jgi:F0F1-type ATP synthase assembly protein I